MRIIPSEEIIKAVRDLCIQSNKELPKNVKCALQNAKKEERSEVCREALGDILQNLDDAKELDLPICQDTGMMVIFAEVGQELQFDKPFEESIQEGVRLGYKEGYLRKSIVSDPLRRVQTNDNTPAIIYTRLVPGGNLNLTAAPKGFGSENMSALKMMNPSATEKDVIEFVVDVVKKAGSRPCPPILVGVGLGGDFEYAAFLAKKALCSEENHNPDPYYANLEDKICNRINELKIGTQGFGGDITALGVRIEAFPTHIAGFPIAVNIGCHVTRHKTIVL